MMTSPDGGNPGLVRSDTYVVSNSYALILDKNLPGLLESKEHSSFAWLRDSNQTILQLPLIKITVSSTVKYFSSQNNL